MYPKLLNYREIGELPYLRGVHKRAVSKRDKTRLDIACDYLADVMANPVYIANYERKLKKG